MATQGDDKQQRGSTDRDLYCRQLEQYLCGAAAAHGLRGNLASVVASIERGGASGSSADPNLAMLRLIGWRDGKHDDFDPMQRPAYHLDRLRGAEGRFRLLAPKHQATHVAHYVLLSRCHETLRASFGEMAGVVLHRYRAKAAKARARDAGGAKVQVELERIRAELLPLDRQIADAQAVLDAPLMLPAAGPAPVRPDVELVLRGAEVKRRFAAYNAAVRAWREPQRLALQATHQRRQQAADTLATVPERAERLRAASACLCAELANVAEAAVNVDEEQQLVDACRAWAEQGQEGRERRDALIAAAEADCRAAHRAWRETGKLESQRWLDQGSAA
jgi:hypothetical protein